MANLPVVVQMHFQIQVFEKQSHHIFSLPYGKHILVIFFAEGRFQWAFITLQVISCKPYFIKNKKAFYCIIHQIYKANFIFLYQKFKLLLLQKLLQHFKCIIHKFVTSFSQVDFHYKDLSHNCQKFLREGLWAGAWNVTVHSVPSNTLRDAQKSCFA